MSAAQLLFTSLVYGISIRVLGFSERHWLMAEDLSRVLEYRSADGVIAAFSRHKHALEEHSTVARVDGEGHAVRLFDEAAVRYLCEHAKRPGAAALWRWLNDDGMVSAPALVASPLNVVALNALTSTPPACEFERRKAYCRELLKTLLRYTTEDEAEELVHAIEDEVQALLSRRHCPGLNDARYELFRRFWLQGGAV